MVASHTTSESWRNWNQKHCSAGSVRLLGLHCWLHRTGSPDPPPPPPATRHHQTLHSQCQNHLELGTQAAPPTPPASLRQRAWDASGIEALQQTLLESSHDPNTQAHLLAVASRESGAWLNALPVASMGLRLDNEVVRIAVGLRLGLPLCRPHQCVHCEAEVDDRGTHSLSCRFSKGRHPRHGAVNDVVKRSLEAAKIPSHLEPTDIYRSDGKTPRWGIHCPLEGW